MVIRLYVLLALFHSLAASQSLKCNQPLDACDESIDRFPDEKRITIKYANKTITKLEYSQNFVDVDVTVDTERFRYRFAVCGCNVNQSKDRRQLISINPLSFYLAESPSHALYSILALDNIAAIKVVQNVTFIFDSEIRNHVRNGGAIEASTSLGVDYDKVKQQDPALSIIGTFETNAYQEADIGIPFLVNAENQEQNPLARAEWIKIFGLVLNRVEKANEEFTQIEKRYKDAAKRAEKAIRRPAVFLNRPIKKDGNFSTLDEKYSWTQPVTDEYIVQLVRDANADYRYIDEKAVAGETGNMFKLSTIVRDFTSADFLVQSTVFPGSRNLTLEDYLRSYDDSTDPAPGARKEIEKLKAVRCATVLTHQKQLANDGYADAFFESIARPDALLADFVQLLHPYLDSEDRETVFLYRYEETENTPVECPNTALVNETRLDGSEFVDTKFEVPGLDRYQIADRLEESIIPEIEKRVDEPFEVFFHHEDVGEFASKNLTVVTVRVQVNSTEKDSFLDTPSTIFGMRAALEVDVRQRNEDGSVQDAPGEESGEEPGEEPGEDPDEDSAKDPEAENPKDENEGGGLSGGGIAGIVIAVIAVVFISGFLVYRRKSKSQMFGGANFAEEEGHLGNFTAEGQGTIPQDV